MTENINDNKMRNWLNGVSDEDGEKFNKAIEKLRNPNDLKISDSIIDSLGIKRENCNGQ